MSRQMVNERIPKADRIRCCEHITTMADQVPSVLSNQVQGVTELHSFGGETHLLRLVRTVLGGLARGGGGLDSLPDPSELVGYCRQVITQAEGRDAVSDTGIPAGKAERTNRPH